MTCGGFSQSLPGERDVVDDEIRLQRCVLGRCEIDENRLLCERRYIAYDQALRALVQVAHQRNRAQYRVRGVADLHTWNGFISHRRLVRANMDPELQRRRRRGLVHRIGVDSRNT